MTDPRHNIREVRAPRGPELSAKSWLTEAPLRMLMNNLDPEVAENPHELVVYGGIGRAARNWDDFDRIVAALRELDDDETLLVQSGKPVGVFRTHADAPRVLIANSNLVPQWATWDHFHELDRKGLMMYGQMTAGSWIYIGIAGHRAGHLRDLRRGRAPALRRRPGGAVDPDRGPRRHGRRAAAGGGDGRGLVPGRRVRAGPDRVPPADPLPRRAGQTWTRRWRWSTRWTAAGEPMSVGLLGNAAEVLPELVRRGVRPDVVTDQTSRPRPGQRLPARGLDRGRLGGPARERPQGGRAGRRASRCASTCAAMLAFWHAGVPTFDYGNNIRQVAQGRRAGADAFAFPGFVPAYIRPLFCRGVGPFRWARCRATRRTSAGPTRRCSELMPGRRAPAPLARHGAGAGRVPGAAGADLLGGPRRPAPARAGVQRDGALAAS